MVGTLVILEFEMIAYLHEKKFIFFCVHVNPLPHQHIFSAHLFSVSDSFIKLCSPL